MAIEYDLERSLEIVFEKKNEELFLSSRFEYEELNRINNSLVKS